MYQVTSQGSNQECYSPVIGPENQYTGQRGRTLFPSREPTHEKSCVRMSLSNSQDCYEGPSSGYDPEGTASEPKNIFTSEKKPNSLKSLRDRNVKYVQLPPEPPWLQVYGGTAVMGARSRLTHLVHVIKHRMLILLFAKEGAKWCHVKVSPLPPKSKIWD